jgi:hypothetical protein
MARRFFAVRSEMGQSLPGFIFPLPGSLGSGTVSRWPFADHREQQPASTASCRSFSMPCHREMALFSPLRHSYFQHSCRSFLDAYHREMLLKSHASRSSDVPSAGRSQFIVTCDLQASPQPREPRSFRFLVAVHHGLRPKSHPSRSSARWTLTRVPSGSSPGRSDSAPNRFPCHLPFAAASLDRTTQNRDWTVC